MSAEELVRKKDRLTQKVRKLESYQNTLRCGRGVEMIRFRFKAGVYGFGWLNAKEPETMPEGMERRFYDFLGSEKNEAQGELRKVSQELEEMGGKTDDY